MLVGLADLGRWAFKESGFLNYCNLRAAQRKNITKPYNMDTKPIASLEKSPNLNLNP